MLARRVVDTAASSTVDIGIMVAFDAFKGELDAVGVVWVSLLERSSLGQPAEFRGVPGCASKPTFASFFMTVAFSEGKNMSFWAPSSKLQLE